MIVKKIVQQQKITNNSKIWEKKNDLTKKEQIVNNIIIYLDY